MGDGWEDRGTYGKWKKKKRETSVISIDTRSADEMTADSLK